MDWGYVHRAWEKWASVNVGSAGEPLKAALLINYDPSGPSRILSTIFITAVTRMILLGSVTDCYPGWHAILMDLKFVISAEQKGINVSPIELGQFVNFIRHNNLQTESFIIGTHQYMVTSIHENWFSARCLNTSKPAGEGVIVIQTSAFLLVALYDGSIGPASCAVATVDQFAWQLSRRNL